MSQILREFLEEIQYSDLNEGLKKLAETADIDTVRTMMLKHKNVEIYITDPTRCSCAMKRFLKKKLTSEPVPDLHKIGRELDVTPRHLRRLIREIYQEKPAVAID